MFQPNKRDTVFMFTALPIFSICIPQSLPKRRFITHDYEDDVNGVDDDNYQ